MDGEGRHELLRATRHRLGWAAELPLAYRWPQPWHQPHLSIRIHLTHIYRPLCFQTDGLIVLVCASLPRVAAALSSGLCVSLPSHVTLRSLPCPQCKAMPVLSASDQAERLLGLANSSCSAEG